MGFDHLYYIWTCERLNIEREHDTFCEPRDLNSSKNVLFPDKVCDDGSNRHCHHSHVSAAISGVIAGHTSYQHTTQ